MEGLRASGENPEFFARGRIAELRGWWLASGRPEPARIVDYGCGIGLGTVLLAEAFPESAVLGVDPSPASIERARAERAGGRVSFETLDARAAPRPADLAHLNGVVHHVPPDERTDFFARLADEVRPNGVIAIFDNNPANPGTRWVMSRIPFDRDAVPIWPRAMRAALKAAGFEPLTTRFLFYFPAVLRRLRPVEAWLKSLPLGAQYGVIATRTDAPVSPAA